MVSEERKLEREKKKRKENGESSLMASSTAVCSLKSTRLDLLHSYNIVIIAARQNVKRQGRHKRNKKEP
jgi:hypothetical protein